MRFLDFGGPILLRPSSWFPLQARRALTVCEVRGVTIASHPRQSSGQANSSWLHETGTDCFRKVYGGLDSLDALDYTDSRDRALILDRCGGVCYWLHAAGLGQERTIHPAASMAKSVTSIVKSAAIRRDGGYGL